MTEKPWRFSVRRAIGMFLQEDERDVEENRRYQPTRTPCMVYADEAAYFTATIGNRKPKTSDDYQYGFWEWKMVKRIRVPVDKVWTIWQAVDPHGKPLGE